MNNNDLRQYINIINENAAPNYEQLDEAGGLLDKPLAALGSRAAKGRLALKQYYKDLLGDWREYAAETGLDKSVIFSQNKFPTREFSNFLKTEYNFDDEMISNIKGLTKKGQADVRQIMQSAAQVYAKKARGAGLEKKTEPIAEPKITQTIAKDKAPGGDIDQAQVYFKQARGDLKKAVSQAKSAVKDTKNLYSLNDLEKIGLSYLAARGHLK